MLLCIKITYRLILNYLLVIESTDMHMLHLSAFTYSNTVTDNSQTHTHSWAPHIINSARLLID